MELHLQNQASVNECLRSYSQTSHYVYAYGTKQKPFANYIGKGIKLRALDHLEGGADDKGYRLDQDWLTIIAKYSKGDDISNKEKAYTLETYLLAEHKPRDNRIAGKHEKEIVMTPFEEIYGTYNAAQTNLIVEDDPTWFKQWKKECGPTAQRCEVWKDFIYLQSQNTSRGKNNLPSLYLEVKINPDGTLFKFVIRSSAADGKSGEYRNKFKGWMKKHYGIGEMSDGRHSTVDNSGAELKGNADHWHIPCEGLDADFVIQLWKDSFGIK